MGSGFGERREGLDKKEQEKVERVGEGWCRVVKRNMVKGKEEQDGIKCQRSGLYWKIGQTVKE